MISLLEVGTLRLDEGGADGPPCLHYADEVVPDSRGDSDLSRWRLVGNVIQASQGK